MTVAFYFTAGPIDRPTAHLEVFDPLPVLFLFSNVPPPFLLRLFTKDYRFNRAMLDSTQLMYRKAMEGGNSVDSDSMVNHPEKVSVLSAIYLDAH